MIQFQQHKIPKIPIDRRLVLFITIVALTCSLEYWIVTSPAYPLHRDLFSLAVTADICILIPALAYLLLVWHKRRSWMIVLPAIIYSLFYAGYILPQQDQILSRILA